MIDFNNTYVNLPEIFYAEAQAANASAPELIAFNEELARDLELKLDQACDEKLAALFTGQELTQSSRPISVAYAGHQFGHFVPQLGDGRAMLLGEVLTSNKQRFDIQLKGSGPTRYSRNGDGKSSLGPVIREYIMSEAMHSLGVSTTRALAACLTGEPVYRQEVLPGGILTRVAASHIRVGTFEFFAGAGDLEHLKVLADYAIDRHYPHIKNDKNIYLSFIKEVTYAQAKLIASWLSFGFIHGVMNTDNTSIAGETIDYGPCAFMDNFSHDRSFSSIDRNKRYAYNNQIEIGKWNLTRLASCLIPLVDNDDATSIKMIEESIKSYSFIYEQEWRNKMRKKLGLFDEHPGDAKLINLWLNYLQQQDLDFTLSFRALSEIQHNFTKTELFNEFNSLWSTRLDEQSQSIESARELMNSVNPIFIARNHQVERAIQAGLKNDFSVLKEMVELFKNPYLDQKKYEKYKQAPIAEERIQATFCGT
ncbi:YdiU family protein [Bacteriovoracaceae bacterium]|nr:YdiU family protein [Bacteriovoracaceae bacterium]